MGLDEMTLQVTRQEALVLFEWLAKQEAIGTKAFQHPAEEKVLWKLQGQLEARLPELFAADYADIVAEARRLVESGRQ
jgi:hypothetical protein